MSLSPSQLGLTTTQQTSLAADTNDAAGVTWSISPSGSGSFTPSTSQGGAPVTFTAPSTAGVYTVTATSITNDSIFASATVGVTDLAGVYTYHNDLYRSGANTQEYALTLASVSSGSFGKLFSCTVDGAIYAQPLWVANLVIGGTTHNVVFVATGHDSVFAFDADQSPCEPLWSASLLTPAYGASAGETTILSAGPDALVGTGYGDLTPETGITGTPVIDPTTGTLYVVSASVDSTGTIFYQRLHALDLATGAEKAGSPIAIAVPAYQGNSNVSFNPQTQLERAALALINGTLFIEWASHEDAGSYYGWVLGYTYNGTSFTQSLVLNVTPNVAQGGIWMSGGAPAVDAAGNMYLVTGNAQFDATDPAPTNDDYGDSVLQLSGSLGVLQYFTPSDELTDFMNDTDMGAGGTVLIDLPAGGAVTHLVTANGKDGDLYVLNRDDLGGLGTDNSNALQVVPIGGSLLATPAVWNGNLYTSGINTQLYAFQIDAATGQLNPASTSALTLNNYGAPITPSISASGTSNGILWVLDSSSSCSITSTGTTRTTPGPAVLEAHDATNVENIAYSSQTSSADTAGYAVRYAVPTVANGKVYVGTRGNGTAACSLTATTGELDVYGFK